MQLMTGRLCGVCRQLSVRIEPCHVLPLPLQSPPSQTTHDEPVSLDSCLRQFASTRTTNNDEDESALSCDRCRQMLVNNVVGGRDLLACCVQRTQTTHNGRGPGRRYQSRTMINHCPPYLVLRLLAPGHGVVPRRLSLGNDVVMATSDCRSSCGHEYQLRALCRRDAVAYVTPDDVTWLRCDDVTGDVSWPVDIDRELSSECVRRTVSLLFYRRVAFS